MSQCIKCSIHKLSIILVHGSGSLPLHFTLLHSQSCEKFGHKKMVQHCFCSLKMHLPNHGSGKLPESFDKWFYTDMATDVEGLTIPLSRGWYCTLHWGLLEIWCLKQWEVSSGGVGVVVFIRQCSCDPSCVVAIFATQTIPAGTLPFRFNRKTWEWILPLMEAELEKQGWFLEVLWGSWRVSHEVNLTHTHRKPWLELKDLLLRWCIHSTGSVLVFGRRPQSFTLWTSHMAA